jgi:hypothetical protein
MLMLDRCCCSDTLGGCFAAEVEVCLVASAASTTLLATDVLSSCIRLSQLGFAVGGSLSPSCFLAVLLYLWDTAGNPRITCESHVSSL